jgi:uracil-DNA glycosylase
MMVFVGSNPSEASRNAEPFQPETRSRQIVDSWITRAGIVDEVCFYNIANRITPGNHPLSKSEIKSSVPRIKFELQNFTRVIALGKAAHAALELAGIPHLALGHPSGLNRQLNDPMYVAECINKLREYAK